MTFTRWSLGLAAMALCAAPALAESLESRVARVEQQLSAQSAPSTREIQSAVDAYLASGTADASLVGGPGRPRRSVRGEHGCDASSATPCRWAMLRPGG